MAVNPVTRAQNEFMRDGGIYKIPLSVMYDTGALSPDYVFREYPKFIRIPRGSPEKVEKSVTMIDGKTRTWMEDVQEYDEYTVVSEAEEERILAGGKTNSQLDEEKEGLFQRCRTAGIAADPGWSIVRLRRELGEAMEAPPGDELAELKVKLNRLQELTKMKAEIAALEARLAAPVATVVSTSMPLVPTSMPPVPTSMPPVPTSMPTASAYMDFGDDPDELRGQLAALGVKVDGRWSLARLREELDRATAPSRSAA